MTELRKLYDADGNVVDAQYPLSVDGDSVYEKDIKNSLSEVGTFTGVDLLTLFNNLDDAIVDSDATNPKWFKIYLERPITASGVGIVAHTGNFSNVHVEFLDRQGAVLAENDDSADATDQTANFYPVVAANVCCIKISFHTADTVTVSFLRIKKGNDVSARIKAIKPDGTETEVNATAGGNLKMSLEEFDTTTFNATPLPIAFPTDGPNFDAFDRLRVSNPETLFDSKQLWDDSPLFWDDQETGGAGTTSTHSSDIAAVTMGVALNTAGKRVRQTFERFNYQPGKSQLALFTFLLDKVGGGTGITREVGIFDTSNGLFLRDSEGTIQFVRRTYASGAAVDTAVSQASWNVDTMDGNGASGITLDFTKTQIMILDFEWLGVGRVRMGFVIDGIVYYAHQFLNTNSLATVYMSDPNLPVQYSIENDGTGAASTMDHICCSIMSEGGQQPTGISRYASTGGTHVDANTEDTVYAIIGIRLKSTNLNSAVKLVDIALAEHTGNKNLEWILLLNPTVAGTFTYSDETNSAVQTAKGASTNTITGGTPVAGGLFSSALKGGAGEEQLQTARNLGSAIDGTPDELVLCARPIGGSTNCDVEAGLQWRELL